MRDRANVLLARFSSSVRCWAWRTWHCGWHFWLICHAGLVVHQFLKDLVFFFLLLLSLCLFESQIGRSFRSGWFSMLSLFVLESYVDAWTCWCISVKCCSHLTSSCIPRACRSCLIVWSQVVIMLQFLSIHMSISRRWSCRLHTLMPSEGPGNRFSGPYIWKGVLWGGRFVVAASIPDTLIIRCDTFLEILTIASLLLSFLVIVFAGSVEVTCSYSVRP